MVLEGIAVTISRQLLVRGGHHRRGGAGEEEGRTCITHGLLIDGYGMIKARGSLRIHDWSHATQSNPAAVGGKVLAVLEAHACCFDAGASVPF